MLLVSLATDISLLQRHGLRPLLAFFLLLGSPAPFKLTNQGRRLLHLIVVPALCETVLCAECLIEAPCWQVGAMAVELHVDFVSLL